MLRDRSLCLECGLQRRKRPFPVPPLYLRNGVVFLRTSAPAPNSLQGLEEEVGGFSFLPEEVYVFQSTGGSGLWERLMVIMGCGFEGSSCTLTSCCTGGTGGFRELPALCAIKTAPQRGENERVKFLLTVPLPHVPHYRQWCLQ